MTNSYYSEIIDFKIKFQHYIVISGHTVAFLLLNLNRRSILAQILYSYYGLESISFLKPALCR